jgi:hypothetical protein
MTIPLVSPTSRVAGPVIGSAPTVSSPRMPPEPPGKTGSETLKHPPGTEAAPEPTFGYGRECRRCSARRGTSSEAMTHTWFGSTRW